MSEDYLKSLRKELGGFSPAEQEALLEEIRSHLDVGEQDPRMGRNAEERRRRTMNELDSPKALGGRFRALYRPDRILDYLLILVPTLVQPYLTTFYINVVMPAYPGGALLIDAVLHSLLALVGWWRRSVALTLFWLSIAISQLTIVTGRLYAYYGIQTIFWAILLAGLLYLSGQILWKNRSDPLLVAFALVTVGMSVVAGLLNELAVIRPVALAIWRDGAPVTQFAANGVLDRALLQTYIHVRDLSELDSRLVLALFFIPSNRDVRWFALGLSGIIMGLGHQFLLDFYDRNLMAPWIYFTWVIVPVLVALLGWWLERSKRHALQLAAA